MTVECSKLTERCSSPTGAYHSPPAYEDSLLAYAAATIGMSLPVQQDARMVKQQRHTNRQSGIPRTYQGDCCEELLSLVIFPNVLTF